MCVASKEIFGVVIVLRIEGGGPVTTTGVGVGVGTGTGAALIVSEKSRAN